MATVTARLAFILKYWALLYPMNSMIIISATIAGPIVPTLVINASHSLAKAPATIITNKTVDILLALGSKDVANYLFFVFKSKPIPTGIAVMRHMVIPSEKILIGGASAPMKCCMENPVISGSVITVAILITAV